ncbi:MAG: hypothetical protein ABJF04_23445 [Reichenbachiella sp.]|uniref:hypothetical protein n=1 Tax=Reichenbachiella sp. TaxID=2184521 RepID=UPI003267D811
MKDLDIKDIWRDGDAADAKAYAKPQIDKMISKGSHSLVHRFIRTLLWEQWINLIILTSIVVEFFWAREWIIGSITTAVNLIFFVYYQRLKSNLKQESIDSDVLAYLYRVQDIIRRFIIHLKTASVVVLIMAVLAAYFLNRNGFYDEVMDTKSLFISLLASMLIACPIAFYLIHLMYGKKARKLKLMIESLEREEE